MDRRNSVKAGEISIPYDIAITIYNAFLPVNPGRMRNADPKIIEAAKLFKLAVENHINSGGAEPDREIEAASTDLENVDEERNDFRQHAIEEGYADASMMHPSAWAAWQRRAILAQQSVARGAKACPGPQKAWYLSIFNNGVPSHGFLSLDRPYSDRIKELSRGGYSCTVTEYVPLRVATEFAEIGTPPQAQNKSLGAAHST